MYIMIKFYDNSNKIKKDYLKDATIEDRIALEAELGGLLGVEEYYFNTLSSGKVLNLNIIEAEIEF